MTVQINQQQIYLGMVSNLKPLKIHKILKIVQTRNMLTN